VNGRGRDYKEVPLQQPDSPSPKSGLTDKQRHARQKTRYPGITFRDRADGSRRYEYFDKSLRKLGQSPYVPVEGGEAEALAAQATMRTRRAKGEKTAVDRKVTFATLAEQWLSSKRHLGAWTKRGYRDALDNILLPRFGEWKIASIDADAIATLIRGLEAEGLRHVDATRPRKPLSASSITNYLKPLSGTLALAVRRGLIGSNPYRNLTSDERPRQRDSEPAHEWSEEQIEALLTAATALAEKKTAQLDYTPILRTAVSTGLRLGELLGLRWCDVDLDGAVLHVRSQWTLTRTLSEPKTKNGVRRVPLTPDMVSFLRRLKLASKFSKETDFVFTTTGRAMSHRNIQCRGFEPARDEAGLPGTLTFHSLRHAFASRCASRGVPITTLSEVMGHGDMTVTLRVYSHLFDRAKAEDAFRAAMTSS
jgi:integrase